MHGAHSQPDLERERDALPASEREAADRVVAAFGEALELHRENHLRQALLTMIVEQLPCTSQQGQ